MKRVLITLIGLFINLFAHGQTAADGEQAVKKLADLYNKEDYKSLYMMLSPEFRNQASEADITGFYNSNLRPMGNITSWKSKGDKNGAMIYNVQFANGALDLTIYLNSKKEIAGMQWLPAVKEKTQKRDAKDITTNNPKQTQLEKVIDNAAMAHLQAEASGGLSIAVIDGDKTDMYFYGGNDKAGAGSKPDAHTLYEIGSITKTFTGIVLAHAINDGKLKADDDIRKYLSGIFPSLEYKGEPIRIKHLANHTSRLPSLPDNLDKQPNYDEQDPYRNYSKEMIMQCLATIKLDTLPGTVSEYSNLGVALLGHILQRVYQQPLEVLVQKYVTGPAKMNNTTFAVHPSAIINMAQAFDEEGNAVKNWTLGAFEAAGGLKSDITDMAAYLQANMNEINADFKLSHQKTFEDPQMGVGLNWMIQTTKDDMHFIWHNGGTAGFTSFCGYLVEKKIGIVVLNNSGANVDALAIQVLKEMKGK